MSSTIYLNSSNNFIPVAQIKPLKKKGCLLIVFRINNIKWMLFRNSFYTENIAMEFPNEHYLSVSSVPSYIIHTEGVGGHKIGWAFPRYTQETVKPFLYFHRTPTRKVPRPTPYYIFGNAIGKNFKIIHQTNLLRML